MAQWGEEDCLSVAADIDIDGFTLKPGIFLQKVACSEKIGSGGDRTVHVAVTSTGGRLHGFTLPGGGAAVHGA